MIKEEQQEEEEKLLLRDLEVVFISTPQAQKLHPLLS